uniref:Uncharacterized protein n=1 Tax=Arundo donax TaxID=35708 RepID=A0A0A8XY97_ARUDO
MNSIWTINWQRVNFGQLNPHIHIQWLLVYQDIIIYRSTSGFESSSRVLRVVELSPLISFRPKKNWAKSTNIIILQTILFPPFSL